MEKNLRKYFEMEGYKKSKDVLNFVDDEYGFVDDSYGFNPYDTINAGGAVELNPEESQPYIVSIQNTTTDAVANAVIFNTNAVFSSFAVSGLNITCGTPNVTYRQLLQQIAIEPVMIGLTYLYSSSGTQVIQAFTVQTTEASGNIAAKVMTPVLRPGDYQTTSTVVKAPYVLDGNTKITIASIVASTTLTMYFYPSRKINPGLGLVAGSMQRPYKNPGVTGSELIIRGNGRALKG